jgi:ubiquinone/menaquinone biosynthesis C-methylase UbiE
MFDNENTHFFYVANHTIFVHLLAKRLDKKRKYEILDAGCGTGLFAQKLKQFGRVSGIDYHPEAVRLSKKRGIKAIRGDISHLPYKANTFDVVTCIDVICHQSIKSDVKFLKELKRVLKPGGMLLLRVAAHPWLMSQHDRYVMTRERYTKQHLADSFEQAGFLIQKLSFMDALLFLPAAVKAAQERMFPTDDHSVIGDTPAWINKLATSLLASERFVLEKSDVPFGNGLLVIAEKPTR